MPEQVRVHTLRQPLGASAGGHAQLHRARGQRTAVAADKQRLAVRVGEPGTLSQPGAQRLHGLAANRRDALPVALAEHTRVARSEVEILESEARELAESQAAGIEHLHERQVAHLERIGGLEVEQPRHLIDIERVRQTLAGLRRRYVERWIAREHALALQEGEE